MSDLYEISELKEHPRNSYFFDDITGDAWEEFKNSIRTSGIIEPIVISQDKVVVSGHQRLRAARELGITSVQCEVKIYESEDEILKQLIETNIRQRGLGNANPVKLGRCLKELERIEGIREGSANEKGNNRIGDQNNFGHQKTQESLAKEIGMSSQQFRNLKALADACPAIQEVIEDGKITATTALKIVKSLSPGQQEEIASQIVSLDKKTTGKDAERMINELKQKNKELEEEKKQSEAKIQELESDKESLEKEYTSLQGKVASDDSDDDSELRNNYEDLKVKYGDALIRIEALEKQKPKTIEVEKEVVIHADVKELAEKDKKIKELEEKVKKLSEPEAPIELPSLGTPEMKFDAFISAYKKFNSTAVFFQPSKGGFDSLSKETQKDFCSIISQTEGLIERMKACLPQDE